METTSWEIQITVDFVEMPKSINTSDAKYVDTNPQ